MIEAEENIHNLKLAFKHNQNEEEIVKAIYNVQRIKMDLEHTPSICGPDGMRGITTTLEDLKKETLKEINLEPDSLIQKDEPFS